MSKKLLDVLEPYEEECLFSWIIRMANYQKIYCLPEYERKKYKNVLLGKDAGNYPNLYFEPCLTNLIKNINLPNSICFSSEYELLRRMTVYPFYSAFLKDNIKKEVRDNLLNMNHFKEYKIIPGADLCFQEKSKHLIKYCPECIKEHGLYLLREHQIAENTVCFEHRVRLKIIHYQCDWEKLNFVVNIPNLMNQSDFEYVKVDKEDTRFQLAILIHQIFEEGLKDEISVIKGKIRKRLKELGYLEYKNYSMEFNKFYTNLGLEENFSSKEKALDFVLKGCFDTKIKKAPSPVDFLFVIYKLFGSLEALYKYEICAKEVQQDKYPQNLKRVLDLEIKTGIIYWPTPLYALKHKKEAHQIRNYCIDKRIEGAIKIGTDWFIPKNAKYPDYKRFISNRETLITDISPGKQYLTTWEYAKKYSKSKERICVLCREGKIKNVIKVKRKWLIPEDAPYPLKKRLEE